MIKSMTGYGRGENEHEGRKFAVEMRAVNHRYGDISIKIPRFMIYLEDRIKKTVAASVHRGKTDVFISYENTSDAGVEIVLNEALALAYISKLDELEALGASGSNKLALAARFPDVITANRPEEDEELLWEILLPALKSAIESFIAMRELEGAALKKDILLKRETMMELLEKIEQRAPLVPLEYKEKLKARVSELLQEVTIDEQRLMAEFTVFADKCCVDEEITRLKSHFSQLAQILEANAPIGRKLDFLVQEMNREANTIGSKSNDIEITRAVIELKSEIEKIREQIQNIE